MLEHGVRTNQQLAPILRGAILAALSAHRESEETRGVSSAEGEVKKDNAPHNDRAAAIAAITSKPAEFKVNLKFTLKSQITL